MHVWMRFLLLVVAFCTVSPAQLIPDLFVLELTERPTGRERGVRRIRDAQASVRRMVAARLGRRASVEGATEVVMNSLFVRTRAGAGELAALPGVRRVWPVYSVRPELDQAVKLLQVSKAWEAVGGAERAGAGVKIGVIDSGVELGHPGFRAETMAAPEGYPRASNEAMLQQLNGKVIVYRSYEGELGYPEGAEDRSGHGTAVAMAVAGKLVRSPIGELQGVAPGAWLGIYKIFAGDDGNESNTAIATKALDDAVADGMDVVNLSFGVVPHLRAEADPMRPALDRAAGLGVMVVKSNGNLGPIRMAGSSPVMGAGGLMVGASWADRLLLPGIRVNGGEPIEAVPGDGPAPAESVSAGLVDLAGVDGSGLGCGELPDAALAGVAVLMAAGGCSFEAKLEAARKAGAVAAVVAAGEQAPAAAGMRVGQATLPAVMVSYRDGQQVKAILAEKANTTVEIVFDDRLAFAVESDGMREFSAPGPGPDGGIRPDLVAVGEELMTAAQTKNQNGELYSPAGYRLGYGTSFAAALVTGGYAVLKAGRPGLAMGEYRSLLVNTSVRFTSVRLKVE
jgi:subtilisin family serine protease